MEYYVIDVETTGVSATKHELTEISIIRCKDLVQKNWYIKIKHPENCERRALEITNKTVRELLTRGKYIEEIIPMVNKFLEEDGARPEERVMIAHNAPFDQRFVEEKWKEQGLVFPAQMWSCTLSMSRKYNKAHGLSKEAKLNDMIVKLGIKGETVGQHGAGVDTRNTYRLRNYFLKNGIVEVEFIKASKNYVKKIKEESSIEQDDPAMDEIFNFQ